MIGAFSRRVAGQRPREQPRSTTNSIDPYCGNYRIGEGHIVGIDRFILDSGDITLLISDYQSGVVRRLFRLSEQDFVMGQGFDTPSPAKLHVHFVREERGHFNAISLRPAGGTESVAERIALHNLDVTFQNGEVTLAGTLITPATQGPHPAIILLHGSGPLTRYSFGPYPHFFASLGLAVLIYDKRGTGASTGTLMDASTATLDDPAAYYPDDLISDALSASNFLKGREDIDTWKIGFWGSSEGGMLTTQVAARSKDVAFMINSSGFMGPLWRTLLYQVGATLRARGSPNNEVDEAIAFTKLWMRVARTGIGWQYFVEQQAKGRREHKPWFFQIGGDITSVQQLRWDWDHILVFDPLPALKKVTCPVLGVFGELDTSTSAHTAESNMRHALSEAGHKDFTLRIFPRASHSLAEMPPGNRMALGVFETLRSWLLARIQNARGA